MWKQSHIATVGRCGPAAARRVQSLVLLRRAEALGRADAALSLCCSALLRTAGLGLRTEPASRDPDTAWTPPRPAQPAPTAERALAAPPASFSPLVAAPKAPPRDRPGPAQYPPPPGRAPPGPGHAPKVPRRPGPAPPTSHRQSDPRPGLRCGPAPPLAWHRPGQPPAFQSPES